MTGLVLLLAACGAGSTPAVRPGPEPSPEAAGAPDPLSWWPSRPPADTWSPVAALLLPTGELVVAEKSQNRIFLLREADAAPYRLPAPSPTPVEWTALAPAPGLSFYALDGPGRKIHQYDFRGNYLGLALDLESAADRHGLGPVDPAGFGVDRSGRAVITDRQGDRVLLFGPGWSYLGTAGESGSLPGAWRRPSAAVATDGGLFLVVDSGNRRVVLLDGVGGVSEVLETEEVPQGVAALDDGRFAVSLGMRVVILDRNLVLRESAGVRPGPECRGTAYATTALTGTAGRIWVGEGCTGRLLELRFEGD